MNQQLKSMKYYFSKLLLFGEYSVINGSRALAAPLSKFKGYWKQAQSKEEAFAQQRNLPDFVEAIKVKKELEGILNIGQLEEDIHKGMYFSSNIPAGYGVGSSGALCAAIYDKYAVDPITLQQPERFHELKGTLANMEQFYHGSSSGTDPLICYLDKTILIDPEKGIQTLSFPKEHVTEAGYQFFLLDTDIMRSTGPLVKIFLEKCEDIIYRDRLMSEYIPQVEEIIEAFLQRQMDNIFDNFHFISHYQFKYFQEMIPPDCVQAWLDGLGSNVFKIKLCGAGGGGFLLGITKNPLETEKVLKAYRLIFL